MRATIQQEIRDNEKAILTADAKAVEAWIVGDYQEQEKWVHWGDRLEARIKWLHTIANRGV